MSIFEGITLNDPNPDSSPYIQLPLPAGIWSEIQSIELMNGEDVGECCFFVSLAEFDLAVATIEYRRVSPETIKVGFNRSVHFDINEVENKYTARFQASALREFAHLHNEEWEATLRTINVLQAEYTALVQTSTN